jgi:hypothetical protein
MICCAFVGKSMNCLERGNSAVSVKAVIFDYKTLLFTPGSQEARAAREVVEWLRAQGLLWCLFTTGPLPRPQVEQLQAIGYPGFNAHVSLKDIPSGKRRGSPDWVDVAAQKLGVKRNETLYIGSTSLDWRTAINAGVLYLHALWAAPVPPGTTTLTIQSPREIRHIVETYLSGPPHWSYSLDGSNWKLRSLLPASAVLPSTSPNSTFKLQDVFTYDKTIGVGVDDARDVLMLFVLASAYLEGLIPANPLICVYPSSRRGKVNGQLKDYLNKAAKIFHGYYKDDLLVRAVDAPDTSLARWRASQSGVAANISIVTQASTVHLGAKYRGKLRGKTVIVFDDFTTKGMSLEWARLLLDSGGAENIILLTIGKYGSTYTRYEMAPTATLTPFALNATLQDSDFTQVQVQPTNNPSVTADLVLLMQNEIANQVS